MQLLAGPTYECKSPLRDPARLGCGFESLIPPDLLGPCQADPAQLGECPAPQSAVVSDGEAAASAVESASLSTSSDVPAPVDQADAAPAAEIYLLFGPTKAKPARTVAIGYTRIPGMGS
jgi:hypothetical protein